jgi:hypothetical protein
VLTSNDLSDASRQEGSNQPPSSDSMDLNVESGQSKSANVDIEAANTPNEQVNED